jgi:outer membrane protein assembly factor BamC
MNPTMKPFRFLILSRLLPVMATVGLLVACASSNDYYRAEPMAPMKVPEGMETRSLEPLYAVPEIPVREDELLLARDYGSYEVPRPDPLATSGATESGVKIQRLGDERWILADAATSQIWPRVQSFLSLYGIGVDVNNPASGLIETGWVRFKTGGELKHRFRVWIEQGLRPGTTEVHVVQRQVPEAFADASALEWTRSSEDPEREAYLLDELAAALALTADNSSASLLGQRVGGEAKSEISFIDREPVLQLRLDYERAWATVIHSLGQDEFVLWENDRAKGVALASHLAESALPESFLGRLFSSDELPEEAPASLNEVLAHLSSEEEVKELFGDIAGVAYGSPKELRHSYLVVIKPGGSETAVRVRSTDGTRLSPRLAREILTVVRRNLI